MLMIIIKVENVVLFPVKSVLEEVKQKHNVRKIKK